MANKTWIGAGGNLTSTWDADSHWNPGAVPGTNDAVFINAAGTGAYIVTENAGVTIAGLTINSVNATLNFIDVTLEVSGLTDLKAGVISFGNTASKLNTVTFTDEGGTFSGSKGQLNVSGGGTAFSVTSGSFSLSGSGAVAVTNDASFTGGTDTISGGTFKASSLTIGGPSTVLTLSGGTITTSVNSPNANRLGSGNTLSMSGSAVLDFTNGGANMTAGLRDSGTLIGAGTVKGVLSNSGSGIVEAIGGKLDLTSNIATSTGLAFKVGGGATSIMQVDGTLGSGNSFTYLAPSGEISYNNASKGISESIVGLNVGSSAILPTNFIDFERYTVTVSGSNAHSGSGATVNLSDGSVLTLSGITNGSPTWFVNTVSNGTGGTDVFLSSVCYAAGTRILTTTGERTVESLMQGDTVLTLSGDELGAQPVKWIGRRRIDLTAHTSPETVAPVRIERGAFADNIPHSDLLVSPDHAIFVSGVLICARQLINGTTIRQEKGWTSVEYFHVELDAHAILLAEGLPAESYLDTGNRGFFANADVPLVLHPDLTDETDYPIREAGSCSPFVWDEVSVKPVWQRLAERAATLGQPLPKLDTITDAGLHIVANGLTVMPTYCENGLFIFVLPKNVTEVRIVSRASVPTDVRPWLDDRRSLGVYVERIVLRGASELQEVPVDHPTLTPGWWAVERDGMKLRRWTDGDAVLPLPARNGPTLLEIHASSSGMIYLRNAEQRSRAA